MQRKIIFITGGARSGKSSFALNEASKVKGKKAYIATAEALDEEMKLRIENHKKDRGSAWDTYEEPLHVSNVLSKIDNKYEAVVLDCLTLWLSNILLRTQKTDNRTCLPDRQAQTTEASIQELVNTLKQQEDSSVCDLGSGLSVLYIVSNEVGMGIVPDNPLAREFRDLAGSLNQKIAALADEVYLVAAGIPIKIKEIK